VETAQAGQSLVCGCGRTLEVPTLRGLRLLQRIETVTRAPTRSGWNALQGTVFATGVVVLLCSLLFSGYTSLIRMQIDTRLPSPEALLDFLPDLEKMPPERLFEFWTSCRDVGLPPGLSPHVTVCRYAASLERSRLIGLAAAAGGLGIAVSSVFLKRVRRP
jgi:hypothetical protein